MKAKFINDVLNEKFEEKSDPIEDMGIGIKKKYEDFLQSNGLVHVHKPFQTALGYAAYQGEYDIVKFILERGIRPDTDHGHPVRQAIRAGNLKMIKLLMEYNVDILSYGDKFLEWTILEGNTYSNKYLEIFEYFLQHGATPGAVFFYSMTNSVDKRYYDLIKKYTKRIYEAIKREWSIPPQSAELSAQVRIVLLPDGEVRSILFLKRSGNSAFDASIEAAIEKASPLPVPTDAELFRQFRSVNLTFSSKD